MTRPIQTFALATLIAGSISLNAAQIDVLAPLGGSLSFSNVTDIATAVGGSGPGASLNDTLFSFLGTLPNAFSNPNLSLQNPTSTVSDYTSGPVEAGDYLVLFFNPGTIVNTGGAVAVFYFTTPQSNFTPPGGFQSPYANGDLGFERLFDHGGPSVPDSGTTISLMGIGLMGLTVARRALNQRR